MEHLTLGQRSICLNKPATQRIILQIDEFQGSTQKIIGNWFNNFQASMVLPIFKIVWFKKQFDTDSILRLASPISFDLH